MTRPMAKSKGAPAQRRARAARAAATALEAGARQRPLTSIDVDYQSEDNYLFSYLSDSATIGIFVRTLTPEPLGAGVHVRLVAPERPRASVDRAGLAPSELELEGEVIWVNSYRPSAPDNLHPGMGIRLVELDDATRARLFELVGRFAVLS